MGNGRRKEFFLFSGWLGGKQKSRFGANLLLSTARGRRKRRYNVPPADNDHDPSRRRSTLSPYSVAHAHSILPPPPEDEVRKRRRRRDDLKLFLWILSFGTTRK